MKPEMISRVLELHAQKVPIRAIARQLKISRDTVRDIVRGKIKLPSPPTEPQGPEKAQERRPQFVKLEPFRARIIEMVEDHNLTAVRILQELKKLSYDGGYTQVKDFVRALKRSRDVSAIVRYEVPAGRQGQIDWSIFPISFGPATDRKLACFGYVLSYSRVLYAEFFERMDFHSFLRGHVNAFGATGGIPKECLYDNLKSVVASRIDGFVQFNEKFLAFARYYGFAPRACQVARPQTKGRVERAFDYIFQSFTNGRTFENLEDLNRQCRSWLEEANRRIHGTTGRVPLEMLQEERQFLFPLPKVPFDTSEVHTALCPLDGLVSFEANRYSMPPTFAGKTVLIRADAKTVTLECDGHVVARHERVVVGARGRTQIDPAHYEGVRAPPRRARSRLVEEELLRLGPKAVAYWEGLKRRLGQGALSQAAKILAMKLEYRIEDIHRAMERALAYEAFGASYVEGILHREAARKPLGPEARPLGADEVARIRDWISSIHVQKRPLDAYRGFLKGEHDGNGHNDTHTQGSSSGGTDRPASEPEAESDGGLVRSGS